MKEQEIKIVMSQNAIDQINLIFENDYTINDQVLRLSIDGKGCNGFDYAVGFSDTIDGDTLYEIDGLKTPLRLDPLVAHYCQDGQIDYIIDFENNTEGFLFTNHNEKKYRGKFFKNEDMLPDIKVD